MSHSHISPFWSKYGRTMANTKVGLPACMSMLVVNLALILSSRMWAASLETSVEKLWVNPNSPVGQNLAYTNKWAEGVPASEVELFTTQTVPPGQNVANPTTLSKLVEITQAVYDIVVRVNGTDYTTYDMCNGRSSLTSYVTGCTQYSAVDFFSEGSFATPVTGLTQYLLDSRLAYPGSKYMLSWAATADTLGTSDFFGPVFDEQCVAPGLILCKEKASLKVPAPYNATKYGSGSGSLFTHLHTMTTNFTNKVSRQVRFRATWMKAKGVLRGMMMTQAANPSGPTCTAWNDPANSQVPGKTEWSLVPCGLQPGGSGTLCSSATCSLTDLDALPHGNFSDTAGCGKCVGAVLFWTQNTRDVVVTSGSLAMPSPAPAPFPAGPLASYLIYSGVANVSNTTAEQNLFTAGAVCPSNIQSKEKRITTGNCLLMWDLMYQSKAQLEQGNVDASEESMRKAMEYMTLLPPQEPVLTPVPHYPGFSNDTLDAIALFNRVTGTTKDARDATWRDLLNTGAYKSVMTTLNRHATRPSFTGKTESEILLALSGVDNDFSVVQNATRVVMGGTTPDLDLVLGGKCECTPGFSGARCENPVDDGVCECGNDVNLGFPPKCTNDVLFGCLPYVGCMGVGNIKAFQDIKSLLFSSYDFSPLTDMLQVAQVLGAQLPQVSNTSAAFVTDIFYENCEAFLPCVEDNFNWTLAATEFPMLPSAFAPVVEDAGYVIAQVADIATGSGNVVLTERALFLARRALQHKALTNGATAVAAYTGTLAGLVAADLTALESCLDVDGGATKLRGCFNTTMLATPIDPLPVGACPGFKSLYGQTVAVTVQQYFECFVDEVHKVDGHRARRSTGGQTAWSPSPVTLKTTMCAAASARNVTQAQCRAGYAGLVTMAGYSLQVKQIDQVALVPGIGANVEVTYAQYQAGKYLWATKLGQPGILDVLKRESFGSSDTRVRAGQDAAFAQECQVSSANHPPINMLPADCQVVFNKVPVAADITKTTAAAAKSDIGVAMVKYKLTGAVLGVCGTNARSRNVGGAECWKDADCGSSKGGGRCAGLDNITPLTNVVAFGSILFTNQAQGLINRMKDPTTAQYRALANAPVIAKKASSDPPSQHTGEHELTLEDAHAVGRLWRHEFIKIVEGSSGAASGADTTALSTALTSEEIAKFSEANIGLVLAGYILMLVYAQVSLISPQKDWKHTCNHTRGLVGMTGVVLVSLAVAAGLGISLLAGYRWSAVATQILPYVMLGIGVNDVFVLVRTFPEYRDDLTAEEAAAQGIGIAASPMTFSNITNACVFAIGILTGMPIIQVMAAQASIITATNYFTNILSMPWLLSLDYDRQRKGRADVIVCMQIVAEPESVGKGSSVSRNVFNAKCVPVYTRFLLSKPGKALSMVYMLGLIIAGAVGVATNISLGLSLADIAPSGSSLQKALAIRDTYFSFNPFYVVLPELDYSSRDTQQSIEVLTQAVNGLDHVMDDSGIAWTKAFMAWGLPVGLPNYNLFTLNRPCDINSANTNGKCGYKYNCTVVLDDLTILDGKVPFYAPTDFYRCLEIWINSDALYDALTPGLVLLDPDAPKGSRKLFYSVQDDVNGVYKLPYSKINFFATKLNTNADYVALIKETASVANPQSTPPSYAGGSPIQYFDQYVGLVDLINTALGLGLAVVFGITFLAIMVVAETAVPLHMRLLSAVWMGAIVVAVIAMSVYEVWAFMTYANIKISAIPAISLIMSLGADVGFNVFFATTFATAHGTRDERVRESLDVMMAPAFDGAITVFLGVVCLAFSPLGFIVLYFFVVWLIILWIGLTNAFVFLPVILSVAGPPPITADKSVGAAVAA